METTSNNSQYFVDIADDKRCHQGKIIYRIEVIFLLAIYIRAELCGYLRGNVYCCGTSDCLQAARALIDKNCLF